MDRRAVVEGIGASWRFFSDCALAESFASAEPMPVDMDFKNLVLSEDSTHETLYAHCLERSLFNILLYDHSFFQFSWTAEDSVRYAYYPNPHVSDLGALNRFRKYRTMRAEGFIEEEEFGQLVSSMKFKGSIPIFRYENAPDQYRPLQHPCSHLHIGMHGENRWAVRRQLTPLAFSMILVKHYYPEEWALGVEPGSLTGSNSFDDRLSEERTRCRVVPHFSREEELAFHFA